MYGTYYILFGAEKNYVDDTLILQCCLQWCVPICWWYIDTTVLFAVMRANMLMIHWYYSVVCSDACQYVDDTLILQCCLQWCVPICWWYIDTTVLFAVMRAPHIVIFISLTHHIISWWQRILKFHAKFSLRNYARIKLPLGN